MTSNIESDSEQELVKKRISRAPIRFVEDEATDDDHDSNNSSNSDSPPPKSQIPFGRSQSSSKRSAIKAKESSSGRGTACNSSRLVNDEDRLQEAADTYVRRSAGGGDVGALECEAMSAVEKSFRLARNSITGQPANGSGHARSASGTSEMNVSTTPSRGNWSMVGGRADTRPSDASSPGIRGSPSVGPSVLTSNAGMLAIYM